MSRDFQFIANGREYFTGYIDGPATACEVARQAARKTPGIAHEVHAQGKLFAVYKLIGNHMTVRMP